MPKNTVLISKSWEKLGGRRGGGNWGMLRVMAFVFPNNPKCLNSWCLLMRRSEWIPNFTWIVHTTFALPTKLSSSQPINFLPSTFLILSPNPLWGSECEAVWYLTAYWCTMIKVLHGHHVLTLQSSDKSQKSKSWHGFITSTISLTSVD